MSFRFPLQKIVDLKVNEKTQAEWLLSKSITRLRMEEHTLHSLDAEKDALQHQLNEVVAANVNISQLQSYQTYIDYLEQQIQRKQADVQQATQVVVEKKVELRTKMVDEKLWENVKQKARNVFEAAERLTEQKVLDEVAINRYR